MTARTGRTTPPIEPPEAADAATWYKDAVIYEVHVRAFADSDGDGNGDFRGLAGRLDYLQSLGVTAIWLLPFYPSPLKDDGYDIADYTDVHPSYGTLADFTSFLDEAHARGLRVITELVLNHTSDQHPWFQRARRAPHDSREHAFYVWSDTPERYADARIIFKDFESSNWSWDPVAQAYFWHRFYSHQPDLNLASADVRAALLDVLDFWLGLGVDGLRLDAVPYLYEREGTNCENLPESHEFLRTLRRHVDARFPHRLLLAEANQWPEDAIAYFGNGDECHMAFHFPLMPRLFMSIRMEDRFPICDILGQTPPIPENCQWALFLRNHDELTLEMVTDEERDYMYRAYAHEPQMRINLGIRRRLAPLLGNDRRRIELMNGLLFSLPGTPVLYYGDEIGMGDNVYLGDRNGVRTPMQWNADRNAGFSRASPQRLYLPMVMESEYRYESLNVEAQQNNPHSLLWWVRRLIALRRRHLAFSRGTLELLAPANRKVLAFLRRHADEAVLLVANLSRYVQPVELDLSAFRGARVTELFGRGRLPAVGDEPYVLTLGPHSFYWLALRGDTAEPQATTIPRTELAPDWRRLLGERGRERLEELLPAYLASVRWFGGKARTVVGLRIADVVPLAAGESAGGPGETDAGRVLFVEVGYTEGEPETYLLPLAIARSGAAERVLGEHPGAVVALLAPGGADGTAVLYDASVDPAFARALFLAIAGARRAPGAGADIVGAPVADRAPLVAADEVPQPRVQRAEQSNTSIVFGERFILKLFRRVEPGVNPELEIGTFLTGRAGFLSTPATLGSLERRAPRGEPWTLAVLQQFIPHQGDAWRFTQDALSRYFERVLTRLRDRDPAALAPPPGPLLDTITSADVTTQYEVLGTYQEPAALLGRRTAEMHLALASAPDDPAFAPEPFTPFYQRSVYQSLRTLAFSVFALLERSLAGPPPDEAALARELVPRLPEVLARFRALLDRKVPAVRIRCHGDYHLGQVLYTGGDFAIIDFEGEPAHALGERRLKRSPLRDAAGMVRSFAYATEVGLRAQIRQGVLTAADLDRLRAAAQAWQRWAAIAFLRQYLETAAGSHVIPAAPEDLQLLLDTFLLEKAIYELGYELNNRPDWAGIPLRGIAQLLGPGA